MDIRVTTVTALWLITVVLLNAAEGNPQRATNTLQQPQKSDGKLSGRLSSTGENPKQSKILKQINAVNSDGSGSYTFGYEADDGSFRVETRSKNGVVKGKYGYIDPSGELKVMEYTAGERTGDEESSLEEEDGTTASTIPQLQQSRPLSQRPTYEPQIRVPVRYLSRQTKTTPSISLPPPLTTSSGLLLTKARPRQDQTSSAQTSSGNISSPPSPSDDDENNKSEQDDDDDDGRQEAEQENKDVNNGQYFRAIPQQHQPTPPSSSDRPRYVPSHQLGRGPGSQYQNQPPPPQFSYAPQQQGFSTLPQQYAGQHQQDPRSFSPQYQGFSPQGGPSYNSRLSGQSIPSPYGGQFDDDDFSPQQGPQQGRFPPSSQFENQGSPPPNVQLQFRGSSPTEDQGQRYFSQQQQQPNFGQLQQQPFAGRLSPSNRQFEGARQLGGEGGPGSNQYVPNLDLDGFSEDADEDGYVDEPPNSFRGDNNKGAAQEKQGVAIKAVGGGRGGPSSYTPQILGPQGVLQGGQLAGGGGREQQSYQPGRSPFGGPSSQGQGPQLSEEQIQQLYAQQQGGFSGPQNGPSQFPQQGFSQGQSPYFGRPVGPSSQSRPSPQGFSPQQNPLLQGQYPSGGDPDEFAGFPQQFLPQGPSSQQGGNGFPPQYFNPNQQQQRPIGNNQAYPFQSQQGGGSGGGFQQGLPPQLQGQGGPGGQLSGTPFDFNQFGTQGGFQQFPQQGGNRGFPQQQQGFPPYQPLGPAGQIQGNYPSHPQQQQQQGGGGLSQQQLAAILQQQQQQQQGSSGPLGGGPQIQGFVPGRFPNQGQYLGGVGGLNLSGALLQQSPSSSPLGLSHQLGGGAPRPVQSAGSPATGNASLAGGLFDERKQLSSSSSSSNSNSKSSSSVKAN